MLSSGRMPTDEETAEEMGIPIERFEVVRRAMALASRSNDATPAISLAGSVSASARIQFHEATWERVIEAHTEGRYPPPSPLTPTHTHEMFPNSSHN